ncbi:seryl-tRNA synthetase [Bacillus thermophilus]|uniref:Seryl-tRNA synthetase n=1 Tax=Siminovitchia thermophila TaxID=1245522 RepID=A0ABS2RC62_9BACI|nr:hypothetical protein [Siminovitchia thermophila]MBM7717251.1 seryl-tRNA synthetase [Siminovitchia thermophila]ONK24358.1 hypothetical protein BLX87_05445 [Bacillus sp. VT-16-64]
MSENQTETEQLYNGMKPKEATEDQTDALLEIEREIESYQSKIAKLDERLAGFKAESIAESKRKAMRELHYNDEQIERYLEHVEGETDEEIKQSVFNLMLEIPPAINYVDPNPMSGRSYRPKHKDPTELGKKVFERIKDKLRWRW